MRLENDMGSGCILYIIQSVVVGYRGHVFGGQGVVVVWGGHVGFGHGHHVDQKVYCPHLH